MRKHTVLFTAFAFMCNPTWAAGIYVDIESETLSEPVSIDGAFHDWRGGFYKGERAFTFNHIESGWHQGEFNIGYIRRYDYEVDMNGDTAEFFYRVNNKLDLSAGKTYDVDFSVRNSYSHGIHFQYWVFDRSHLKLRMGVSFLQGLRLTEGALSGNARVLSNSDYEFDVGLDYYFSKEVVFDLPVDSPTGYGWGNDIYFMVQINPRHRAEILARDILGAIYWLDTPHINAHVASDTKTYDQDGWVRYDPVLSGKKSYRNFTQMLATRVDLKWSYAGTKTSTIYSVFHYNRLRNLYRFGVNYKLGANADVDLSSVDAGGVTIAAHYRQFWLSLTADSLRFDHSHRLGLSLYFAYLF